MAADCALVQVLAAPGLLLALLAEAASMDRRRDPEVTVWSERHRTPFGVRAAGCTLEVSLR